MDNQACANTTKPSLTFFGRRGAMRMTSSILTHIGNPSHIKMFYDRKKRFLYLLPAKANELDTLDVTESMKGTMLYRSLFNKLVYNVAGWHDGLTYRVYGEDIPEHNGLAFDLKQHDILWRNKKIFVVV